MKCPSCAKPVNDSVDRCPACGFHLEAIGLKINGLPRKRGWLIDAADVIEEEYANKLYHYLLEFHARTGIEFYIVTVGTSGAVKPAEYVFYFLNHYMIGGPAHRGLVLMLFEKERTIGCELGYSLERLLSDEAARDILLRDAVPALKPGGAGKALYFSAVLIGDILRYGRSRFKRLLHRLTERLHRHGRI